MKLLYLFQACICVELIAIIALLCFEFINNGLHKHYIDSIGEFIVDIMLLAGLKQTESFALLMTKDYLAKLVGIASILIAGIVINILWNHVSQMFMTHTKHLGFTTKDNDIQNQLRKWIHKK